MMMANGWTVLTCLIAAVLAGGCQQRSRGPASAEAERLMENPPSAVTGEESAQAPDSVAPDSGAPGAVNAVPPAEPAPAQPAPSQPAPSQPAPSQPAPARPAEASAPAPPTPAPTTPAPTTPAPTTAAPAARPPLATAPSSATLPATRTATTLATRGTIVHVAADADEAARLRNWPVSVAYYGNGNVVAGPVYRFIPAPPRTNHWWDAVLLHESATTALTIPQFIATPFWALITPPTRRVEYHGEEVPPSYTVDEKVPYYENEKVPGIWVIGK